MRCDMITNLAKETRQKKERVMSVGQSLKKRSGNQYWGEGVFIK